MAEESTLGVNQDQILQESLGESRPFPESGPLEARGRDRRVSLLRFGLSDFPRERAAGCGRAKRSADSVWLPPGANVIRVRLGF